MSLTNQLIIAEIDDPIFQKKFFPFFAFTWGVETKNNYDGLIHADFNPEDIGFDIGDVGINSVRIASILYLEVSTLADVIDTERSWYIWEPSGTQKVLLIHFDNHNSPFEYENYELKIGLIFGIFKTNSQLFDGVIDNQQYYPRLSSDARLKDTKDDLYFSKQVFENSSIEIDNEDFRFIGYNTGIDLELKKHGNLVKIKLFTGDDIENIDYVNDFTIIYNGQIETIKEGLKLFLGLIDIRKSLSLKTPFNYLNTNLLPDYSGSNLLIPQLWGVCFDVPVTCLNPNRDQDTNPGPYQFLICDNLKRQIATDSVSAVYIDGVNKSLTPTVSPGVDSIAMIEIGSIYFETVDDDGGVSYSNMSKVTIDCEGYLESSTLIETGMEIIRAIILDNYGYDYIAVFFDTTTWDTFENNTFSFKTNFDIGYYLKTPKAINKQIEEIAASLLGEFLIDENLKFSWSTDDETESKYEIKEYEVFPVSFVPMVSSDPTNVLKQYRIGYKRKWAGNANYEWIVNDDNAEIAVKNYNSFREKDFKTLINNAADVDEYMDRMHIFTAVSLDTINIKTIFKTEALQLKGGDWITGTFNHPNKEMFAYCVCQVLSRNIDIENWLTDLKLRIIRYEVVSDLTLLGLYEFEDNVNDSSGNDRTATAYNSPSYTTGKIGSKAISLDGINQYVELPSLADWEELNGKDFTCAIWFKSTDKTTFQFYIGNYGTLTAATPVPNQYWALAINSDGKCRVQVRRDNGAETVNSIGIADTADGAWHLGVFVKRGLDIELWVDNNNDDTQALSQEGSTTNNEEVRMGVGFARYVDAEFDQLRLYDRALSTDELTALFNE